MRVNVVAEARKKTDRQRTLGKFTEIPLLVRLKARNLYLVQGLSHQEIAEQTGLTKQSSEALASREGWVKVKRERAARFLAKADARTEAQVDSTLDAIASLSEQHAIRGLDRVGQALESGSEFAARDFQSYTSGVKNLVSIMRDIRAPEANAAPAGSQLNVFVMRVGDVVQPTERNVTPDTQVPQIVASPVST